MRKILIGVSLLLVSLMACLYVVSVTDSAPEAIPQKMFAGEIHYSRIPVEYWEHRIKMVKALGLNALSVYIMWNYHEVEKGKFDY